VAFVAFAVLLDRARGVLRTASANEQALRANAYAKASPLRGLEAALAAVDAERNVDTLSALYSATVSCREQAELQHEGAVWMAAG
jgi:hypothetical protein